MLPITNPITITTTTNAAPAEIKVPQDEDRGILLFPLSLVVLKGPKDIAQKLTLRDSRGALSAMRHHVNISRRLFPLINFQKTLASLPLSPPFADRPYPLRSSWMHDGLQGTGWSSVTSFSLYTYTLFLVLPFVSFILLDKLL